MLSLRNRTLLMVAGILALTTLAGYLFSSRVIEKNFREFEARDAQQGLARVNVLLTEQLSTLAKTTRDYAVWDLTYQYLVDRDPAYIEDNYELDALRNLDVDFVAVIDVNGQVVVALAAPEAIGSAAEELETWSGPLRDKVLDLPLVHDLRTGAGSQSTFVFIKREPLSVGVSSILDNDGNGPARGALVFARRLTPERLAKLRRLTQVQVQILPYPAHRSLPRTDVVGESIESTTPLLDGKRRPLALLAQVGPRVLSEQIAFTRWLVLLNVLAVAAIGVPMAFLIFDLMVLRRVSSLVSDIARIREKGGSDQRLPEGQGDEIDRISGAVNSLLDEADRSREQLRFDALHDSLTGLGNRQLLLHSLELAQARLSSGKLARFTLLLVDLDGFKDINDLHGHIAGDQVLKTIARRLAAMMREGDLALRLGGDEFAMLIQSTGSSDVEGLSRRLLEIIARPLECEGRTLRVHASIGILDVDRMHRNDTPATLLSKVDIAMYAAKRSGRNGFRHFSETMQRDLGLRKELEQDLRAAIDEDLLDVWYQPVVGPCGERVVSVEALSRWTHPRNGPIDPGVFISMAEEMQLISRIDRAMLRKACRTARLLREKNPGMTMSANVSVLTLVMPDILDYIVQLLQENALPGDALLLEVTETALARNERDLRAPMMALRQAGVRFQIDDFGKGYSSLSRLHLLPLDIVKIDRSFVEELEAGDQRMCQAIIRLAHHLDMRVIAEGVHSRVQHEQLVMLGCDEMQGFFYFRPMAVEHLIRELDAVDVVLRDA